MDVSRSVIYTLISEESILRYLYKICSCFLLALLYEYACSNSWDLLPMYMMVVLVQCCLVAKLFFPFLLSKLEKRRKNRTLSSVTNVLLILVQKFFVLPFPIFFIYCNFLC